MDHVLQIMRMQGLLHALRVAGEISLDVVGHRGTHGGRFVTGRSVVLRHAGQAEEKEQG